MSEIFFDLVFIFALTRVIAFMGRPPTALSMVRGLILLLLLWMSWTTYAWLSNRVRADLGLIRAGILFAMLAVFVTALVIPGAWRAYRGFASAPVVLALAYIALRIVHFFLYVYATVGSRQSRKTLRIFAAASALAWIPLIFGATVGGTVQTVLWASTFAIEFGGASLASVLSGWQLRSAAHFAERHGLVLMIALGESLIAAGARAVPTFVHGPELVAAVLGFVATVCLWWLYFDDAAVGAAKALERAAGTRRNRIGRDGYSLAHFPMISGIIYFALGSEQVLAHVSRQPLRRAFDTPLDWPSTVALYGGVALFLGGRAAFLAASVRSVPVPLLAAAWVALALLPAGRFLPALAALGLLVAFLVVQISWERLRQGESVAGIAETTSV
ncbi:MAG TPA: low temperature requirement protein A [Rugosimonospora sp.]|jgi:low temperature requirement protein LtrA